MFINVKKLYKRIMSCYCDKNSKIVFSQKKVAWTENDTYYLVLLYQEQSCLWKKDSPLYLNYYARRLAYQTIHEEVPILDITIIEVIMKLREVRKTYVDELQKIVEAETFGLLYKSQYIWFETLNSFLSTYLHVDEIETIEENYYGNIYCDENELNEDSCTCEILSSRSPETIITSRCSTEFSMTLVETPPRLHPYNGGDARVTQIRKFPDASARNFSRCSSKCIDPGSKIRLVPWASKSDSGRSSASVYKNESIQPISKNEESSELSSVQSWLTARISCDQYDLFATNVACRLKQMKPDAASTAQMEIQRLLTSIARDTESNSIGKLSKISNVDAFSEENGDCYNKVIPSLPYSRERYWVSQESNINV